MATSIEDDFPNVALFKIDTLREWVKDISELVTYELPHDKSMKKEDAHGKKNVDSIVHHHLWKTLQASC